MIALVHHSLPANIQTERALVPLWPRGQSPRPGIITPSAASQDDHEHRGVVRGTQLLRAREQRVCRALRWRRAGACEPERVRGELHCLRVAERIPQPW